MVFIKSHEKGLITKEYLVTDTHLNFAFTIQYFGNKTLTALQICFKLQLLLQHYEPVFLLTIRHLYDTPTLKTKALRLASKEERVKHLLL